MRRMDFETRQKYVEKDMIKAWLNWKDCLMLKRRELSLIENEADRNLQNEKIAWLSGGVARIVGTCVAVGGFLAPFVKSDSVLTLVLAGAAITVGGAVCSLTSSFNCQTREKLVLEEANKAVQKEEEDLEDMIMKSDNFEQIRDTLNNYRERRTPLSDLLKRKFPCESKDFVMVGTSGMAIHTTLAIVFGVANCLQTSSYIRNIIGDSKVLSFAIFAVLFDLYLMVRMSRAAKKDGKSNAGKVVHEVIDKLSSSETERIIQHIDELIYSMSMNN